MKKLDLIVILTLSLAVARPAGGQQSPFAEVLLGQALHQEEVEGNLEAAIGTYKKLLVEYPDNRPIAARALLQLGLCYERLGIGEVRSAYERLLRDYADQGGPAAQARRRLASLPAQARAGRERAFTTRQVWSAPDIDIVGAPSPDGKHLTFVDWTTGDLAVRDLESGASRRLTNKGSSETSEEFAMFSRWSPEGSRIAYDWYDGKCCVDLRVVEAVGGNPRILVDYRDDEWMQTYDWSPDGKHILVFVEKKDGTRQIVLISAADGTGTILKTFEKRGRFPQMMCFSRDGRHVVYDQPQEDNGPEHDIYSISVDGGREVALVSHPAHDTLLGWPPDGDGILLASDRTGALDMWFLPVSGGRAQGRPELVRRGLEQVVPMGFTQDGSFYYAQGRVMLDVYVATMDRQTGNILAPPEKAIKRLEGANSWPEYSPDGKYLAYLSTRSRRFQAAIFPNILCVFFLENGQERQFPTKFTRLAGLRWSPDCRLIYLAAWDYRGMGIYRADSETGSMAPVLRYEGPQQIHGHDISRDGRTLFYVRRHKPAPNEPYRILSRDLATGEEKELYAGVPEAGRPQIALSPDGRRLAVLNTGKEKTLRVIPVGGGETRDVFQFEESRAVFSPTEWTADGRHILFGRLEASKAQNPPLALWRISADGGAPNELGLVMANFENLTVHPDGQHLALSSLGFIRKFPVIWVMENYLAAEARE